MAKQNEDMSKRITEGMNSKSSIEILRTFLGDDQDVVFIDPKVESENYKN